jgi:hypothetical protein
MSDMVKRISQIFADQVFHIPDTQRGYAWEQRRWADLLNVERRLKNAIICSRFEIRGDLDRGFSRLRKRPDIVPGCFQHAGLKLRQL